MEDKELQYTIDKISSVLTKIGSLDIYSYTHTNMERQHCQGVINKAFDELFKLRKHLLYIQSKGEKSE